MQNTEAKESAPALVEQTACGLLSRAEIGVASGVAVAALALLVLISVMYATALGALSTLIAAALVLGVNRCARTRAGHRR